MLHFLNHTIKAWSREQERERERDRLLFIEQRAREREREKEGSHLLQRVIYVVVLRKEESLIDDFIRFN